jgi:ferritin-like metal-binding protein YciE
MADTETSMRVTLRDVYSLVMEMRSQLEKLNQNLPNTHQKLEEHEHETAKKFDDLEVRLRKVEMRVWQIMAIAGFVSAAMPLILRALP